MYTRDIERRTSKTLQALLHSCHIYYLPQEREKTGWKFPEINYISYYYAPSFNVLPEQTRRAMTYDEKHDNSSVDDCIVILGQNNDFQMKQ